MITQKLRVLLYLLSGAALCASIAWFVAKPDWEPGVGVLTSLAGLLALFLSDRSSSTMEEQKAELRSGSMPRPEQKSSASEQARSPINSVLSEVTPRWNQPLTVTFADGVRGVLGMSASYYMQRESAARLVATFGSSAQVETYMKKRVESGALSVLERVTSDEARRSRLTLQQAIVEAVQSQILEPGLLLHSVALGEITPIG